MQYFQFNRETNSGNKKRQTQNIIVNTMLCFGYWEEKTKTSMESITCLSWLRGGWVGPLPCFDSREGERPLMFSFSFLFFQFFFLNFELKKKTHTKRHRFSDSNGSNNWVVTEPWIDKNWKLEDWNEKQWKLEGQFCIFAYLFLVQKLW